MRRSIPSVLVVVLFLAGCQTQPHVNAHIDTVNAEYRQLEDYVYCLEDEVAQLQQQLDDLRAARAGDSGGQSGPGRGGLFRRRPDSAPRSRSGATAPDRGNEAPQIEMPGSSSPTPPGGSRSRMQRPDLVPPADSPPHLVPPAVELPPPAAIPSPPEQIRPTAGEQPLATAIPAKPRDTKVTHITLSPLFTGGADFDSQPGDDGICVVVEPRNAGDEYVPEAGPISIVVLDPARQGDAARVARWDFDLSAARQKLANSAATTGIKLELPWPAAPPGANRLHLFVRYETPDGRKLQTDREIFLTPPGQVSSRWTPRTAVRQRPAAEAMPTKLSSQPAATAPAGELANAAAAESPQPPAPPAALSSDASTPPAARTSWSPHR